MNDDDDFDYFQSLQGPAQYGSHQASQRLREPIRRPQAQTFAATPPGMRTRQATTRNRIDREEYWADEQPVLEDLSHVSVHAKVPVIPPITERASIKQQCLMQFVKNLKQTKGEWTDKTDAVANKFIKHVPNLESQAKTIMDDMEMFDSDVYEYNAGELLDSTYQTIQLGNNNNFLVQERENTHWYRFAMDVDPANMNVGNDINTNSFPPMRTYTVFVRASRHNDRLRAEITKNIFNNTPKQMVQIHFQHASPWKPAVKKTNDAAADPDAFETQLREFKHQVKFDIMAQLLKQQYVREDVVMDTPVQRLLQIKQQHWNQSKQKMEYRSVTAVKAQFENILQIIGTEVPNNIPNLSETFVHALSQTLHKK